MGSKRWKIPKWSEKMDKRTHHSSGDGSSFSSTFHPFLMVFPTVKVLLGTILTTYWSISLDIPTAVYQQGREYYQQGLAEYRKKSDERNVTLAFLLLQEACVETNYTIPTFVHDYAFALRSAGVNVAPDVITSVLEHGVMSQLELLELVTSNHTSSYNTLIFDHKHEIALYSVHLINFYDVVHEHTGLGWEELGFVVQYATSRQLTWQRLTDYLLRAVGSSYAYTGIDGDLHSVHATVSGGNRTSASGSDSNSISGKNSDKDMSNQSSWIIPGTLNHTLQLQQYMAPFNCSARHEDKDYSDKYYDNPPAWSREEMEALPYSIPDLLHMLIEGLWLRPRDPALSYTLAVLYMHIHEQPSQPIEQEQPSPDTQPLQSQSSLHHDNTSDTTTSTTDLLYTHLQLQYPPCCISRYLAHALSTSTHALRSSPVTCYLKSGAIYRQWKRARNQEKTTLLSSSACVCPGLARHVTALSEYRQSQGQRKTEEIPSLSTSTVAQLMQSKRLFDARLFGLCDYPYDHVERTLFADYLIYNDNHIHSETDNDTDNDAVHDSDHNIVTPNTTTSTTTSPTNIGVFITSPHPRPLVKLQIGCSDTSCARVGWLVADARSSLVTHFQLTAALYPIKRHNTGATRSNIRCASNDDGDNHVCGGPDCSDGNDVHADPGDGNISCDVDDNDDNDTSDYNVNSNDGDGDDGDNDNEDNEDVIPAGSVDVLYSSHTLEHISHYHSNAHDLHFFHRSSQTTTPIDITGASSVSPPPASSPSHSPPPSESVTVVLRRWRRVLRTGGVLLVSVPDLTQLAKMILDTKTFVSFKDKITVINVLYGGQDYPYNFHQAGFTYDILSHYLTEANFCDVEQIIERDNFRMFEDTSCMTLGGYNISLNVRARAC